MFTIFNQFSFLLTVKLAFLLLGSPYAKATSSLLIASDCTDNMTKNRGGVELAKEIELASISLALSQPLLG